MSYFHSMIAFIGECELKTRDELPEHVLTSGMASYIEKKQDKILTDEEVKAIVEQIEKTIDLASLGVLTERIKPI